MPEDLEIRSCRLGRLAEEMGMVLWQVPGLFCVGFKPLGDFGEPPNPLLGFAAAGQFVVFAVEEAEL